jgi:hypothetical protein
MYFLIQEQESYEKPEEDYDSGDDSQRLYIKEEEEEIKEENSMDSNDRHDTRLSEMHNIIKSTEDDDIDEDIPLVNLRLNLYIF